MNDHLPREDQLLGSALKPGSDCPSVVQLEQLLNSADTQTALAQHVESCGYCRTELSMLREFQSEMPRAEEAEAIRDITAQLRARSKEFLQPGTRQARPTIPWWRALWSAPWFSPAALALAGVLVLAVVGLQNRSGPPPLHQPNPAEEVLRSNAIQVTAPLGDIKQLPKDVEWMPVSKAVRYQVRLLEVDGSELWNSQTGDTRVVLPQPVLARIVPAKTLAIRVSAFDANGREIGDSGAVRFRLLQKIY